MQLRAPKLSTEQIAKWMRADAPLAQTTAMTPGRAPHPGNLTRHHPGFDFRNARQSLHRARAKNDIDTIKPLRRLRRNQGAINEALIDCLSAALAVNKQMAAEIVGLSGEIALLRKQIAEPENRPDAGAGRVGTS